MKIAGTLAVLSTVAHAWIGLWTMGTDYIRPRSAARHIGAFRLSGGLFAGDVRLPRVGCNAPGMAVLRIYLEGTISWLKFAKWSSTA